MTIPQKMRCGRFLTASGSGKDGSRPVERVLRLEADFCDSDYFCNKANLTTDGAWQEVRQTDKAEAFLGIIEWEYETIKDLVRGGEKCK